MRLLRFFNRQRAVSLDRAFLRRLARRLLEECLGRPDYQFGVHFIGATEMACLNQTFLGHEGSTDVITFDYREKSDDRAAPKTDLRPGQLHGEIYISVDDALIHARRFRVRWPSEVTRYLVHGVLHLEGFDDTDPASRRQMKRLENRLLKELSASFDLDKMSAQ